MAHHHWVAFSGILAFSGALTACQQTSPVVALPPPSFSAPPVVSISRIRRGLPMPMPEPVAIRPAPAPVLPQTPARVAIVPPSQRDWVPPVPARPWRWIVIHHSATATGGAMAFDKMHRAKGWDELGYDFVIGNGTDTADGQVEVGSRWIKQKIGAHAKTADNRFNEYGVGICLVGNFDITNPSPKQMRSVEKLCAFLMERYHITPDRIYGHGQTKRTDCPGRNTDLAMIRQRAATMAGMSGLADAARPSDGELLVAVPR